MNEVNIKIGSIELAISAFCYQKVGNTENMKFRVISTHPEYDGVFDDFQSVKELINSIMDDKVLDTILMEEDE